MPQAIKKAAQPNEPDHGALEGKSWYYCVDGAKNPSCFITVAMSQYSTTRLIFPSEHSKTDTPGTFMTLFEVGIPGMSPLWVPVAIHSAVPRLPATTTEVGVKVRSGNPLNQAWAKSSTSFLP